MSKWSAALERAFQAHVQTGGSGGSSGSAPEKGSFHNRLIEYSSGTTCIGSVVPVVPPARLGTTGTTSLDPLVPAQPSAIISDIQRLSRPGTTGTTGTTDDAPIPAEWAEGLMRMECMDPLPGFTYTEWRDLIDDGRAFLDCWGPATAQLGWTSLDLFGVHPIAPTVRYDCMGLVPLFRGDKVVAIDASKASTQGRSGARLTYLRRTMPGAILLWEFAHST